MTRTPTERMPTESGPMGSAGAVPVAASGSGMSCLPQTLDAVPSPCKSDTLALASPKTWMLAGRPGRVQPSGSRPLEIHAARYGRSTSMTSSP